MQFEDRFVAFVDILGFKDMVRAAERGATPTLEELLEMTHDLGGKAHASLCPHAPRLSKDASLRVTQISDCAIVSAEASPAGAINVVGHCWGSVISLMAKGVMCRGYITRGALYHRDGQVLGSGYMAALEAEQDVSAFKKAADERGTPFVEVDQIVIDYIASCGDACVKMMFERQIASDGSSTALFPFKRLSHSFTIGGLGYPRFDPLREKKSNQQLRQNIQTFIERIEARVDRSNTSAVRKAEHYVGALQAQLLQCDRTDVMIDKLSEPVAGSVGDIFRRKS